MGKRIIQQARGKGSSTYRVRKKAFMIRPGYLTKMKAGEEWEVINLVHSPGHSAPIAKFKKVGGNEVFFNFAAKGLCVGQKIVIDRHEVGDIALLGDLKNSTEIFNVECRPKDGGKLVRSGGSAGIILAKKGNDIVVQLPSKKIRHFNSGCRATIGKVAGHGRVDKPFLKAGKKYYMMKSKSKLWPRTSAVAMNAIDHPFGSGRGKRIKSKIVKRNSPPGRKVGLLRPKRTGRKKK